MNHFSKEIVDLLNEYFSKNIEHVESVLLASYSFRIDFTSFYIQCNERVTATINGKVYEWDGAPNGGPWGALGTQIAYKASLKGFDTLVIAFQNGDSIEISTVESQHESVIFGFPPRGDAIVMEIF